MMRYLICLSILFTACDSEKGVTAFNAQPEATISSHTNGDTILEGVITTFRGSVSDPDHSFDQLSAAWYSGLTELCPPTTPESDGVVQCQAVLSPSDDEIRLEVRDAGNASGIARLDLTVAPTDAPSATILSPEASSIAYSDQLISFRAEISDTEDSPDLLTAYWTSSQDGELTDVDTTPSSEGIIEGFAYLSQGEHAIQLFVEDSTQKLSSTSMILQVGPPNSAPTCSILAPSDESASVAGGTVNFTAQATDVDIPADWLSVEWTSDKDGALGSSTPTSDGTVYFSADNLSENTHTIQMTVSDELGTTCTTAIRHTIGTPPSIALNSPMAQSYPEGAAIEFNATVSDAQDLPSELSLDWQLNGSPYSTQGATSSGLAQFSDSTLTAGSYTLLLTATDLDGLTDAQQVNFSVNGLPSAPSVAINPDPAYTTQDLTGAASGSIDPEGQSPSYTYQWLSNGILTSHTSAVVPNTDTSKGEIWTLRVTPNDGIHDGPYAEQSITIQNTPPSVTAVTLNPSSIYNDELISCSISANDPDEVPTSTFTWSLDGVAIASGNSLDLSTTSASAGQELACTVIVTDSDGASDTASTSVWIGNRSPSVTAVLITPSSVTATSSLSCTASVSDPDGESLSPDMTWTIGSATFTGSGLSLDPSIVSPGDSVTCTVSVTDSGGLIASDSSSVTVSNTAPVVTASINASDSTNTALLQCIGNATDIDDYPASPSLSYEWFDANGNSLGSNSLLQLDSSMGTSGDTITCLVTATDQSGDTASASAAHLLSNALPVVDSITISPSAPSPQTTSYTCQGSASDSDGDPVSLTYSWLVNGAPQSETSDTLSGSYQVGTTITCTITPFDGSDYGSAQSASVTIFNSLPSVASLTLSPSTAYTNDTLTANVILSDPDGQPLTAVYEWHVVDSSGTDTMVQNGSNNQLDGAVYFSRDESVYVRVTPNDGLTDGPTSTSSSRFISNSAPLSPNITIQPNPAVVGIDDIICELSSPTVDPDGDSLVHTFSWTDDSGTLRQTTAATADDFDVYDALTTSMGIWTCEVTASDGQLSSPTVSTTVSVESNSNCTSNIGSASLNLSNGTVIDMVLIPSCTEPLGRYSITRNFYMMQTEVTESMWADLMGSGNYSNYPKQIQGYDSGDVGFPNTIDFANALSDYAGLPRCYSNGDVDPQYAGDIASCDGYRLPTCAEWEYAARSGTSKHFWTGDGVDLGGDYSHSDQSDTTTTILDGVTEPLLSLYANYNTGGTIPVGQRLPNGFGLYDMHGNLWEYVNDWYPCDFSDATDPNGPASQTSNSYGVNGHALKGGNFIYRAEMQTTTYVYAAFYGIGPRGFRLVRSQ